MPPCRPFPVRSADSLWQGVGGRLRIPATWMRGGTSKGLFFLAGDLPAETARRDALLLRALGSPDPYGKQIDGLGGATSSTSKVVLVSPSSRQDCDVDYLFGQVPMDRAAIDWSGNCGNLTAAVGPFAIDRGLVDAPRDGLATVRIWQANIGKVIHARVPMRDGEVEEDGDFRLDGVAFPGAPIELDFLDPGGAGAGGILPTGCPVDRLEVPGLGPIEVTLVNAGNPMVLAAGADLGIRGSESQGSLNADKALLERCEALRAAGSVAMGLAADEAAARARQHTPKLALLASSCGYMAADGREVAAGAIDLAARVLSMGVVHHAIPGTAAIAIAAAAAVPGTLARRQLAPDAEGPLRIGHPSGRTEVGVEALEQAGAWQITRARMKRSARILMEGVVSLPAEVLGSAPSP